ncbi:Prefoldin alpha subunit [Flagelloscypha sp. PMI_526]|nr:Prefoldin alpha subunit [Flagelloscypha sp. PMI_526]
MSQSQQQPQAISVNDLDVSQLVDVRRQLEEELNHLTNSLVQLRTAQTKFEACADNIKEIDPKKKDNTILVPLTNSLYVPGKLTDPEHVIVDVGTGYFIQKTRPQAIKYYTDKAFFVKSNVEKLDESITKKRENLTMLVQVLQQRVASQAQANAATASTNSTVSKK